MKTKKQLMAQMYASQKSSSKKRSHKPPNYTFEEWCIWCNHNGFDKLYQCWVDSKCDKMLIPSGDRIDDNYGYSFDNLGLTTWGKNLRSIRTKTQNRTKTNNILCFTLVGETVNLFDTYVEASKETGISKDTISKVCRGLQEFCSKNGRSENLLVFSFTS